MVCTCAAWRAITLAASFPIEPAGLISVVPVFRFASALAEARAAPVDSEISFAISCEIPAYRLSGAEVVRIRREDWRAWLETKMIPINGRIRSGRRHAQGT